MGVYTKYGWPVQTIDVPAWANAKIITFKGLINIKSIFLQYLQFAGKVTDGNMISSHCRRSKRATFE